MAEIIYSKYSNERSRRFAIRTDILEENKKRWLQKKALYPEGKEHMDNLASWNSRLNAVYEKVPFVCNKCEIVQKVFRSIWTACCREGKSRLHLIGLWSF